MSESLWANIAAKRARGEKPAKPGEKGYPKTLGVKEEIDEGDTGYKPGWMLKKDPELAKKLKDKTDLAKKRQASYGNPAAGKSVKEEVELDEAVDPSKIAGNPKAYGVDTVKKAYYHKKVSASDKESLGRHLDRHHGHKEWRKPLVKEDTARIDELSNDTLKSYAKKAGAEATGVKGKHLSPEKSNKRFDGFAKAVKRLTKEDTDQLDELSKETLGSYKHKAELSIPADDREYKNRSKGIAAAEKKLKEEIMAEGAVKDLMMDLRVMPAKEFEAKYRMTKAKARAEMRPSSVAEAKQLDELSPNLLHRYVKKAAGDMGMHAVDHGKYGDQQKDKKSINKAVKRLDGITNASARMADKANRYDESEINDLAAEYINENNITLEELENMTEEELNELIGAAVGGAFKLAAKAAVGAGRLAGRLAKKSVVNKKGNFRFGAQGKADAEKSALDREEARDKAIRDRKRFAKERQALKDKQNTERQSNN